MLLSESDISCPYCGETITILVDDSVPEQSYIEDCQVCCRPIEISIRQTGPGGVEIEARHEDQ